MSEKESKVFSNPKEPENFGKISFQEFIKQVELNEEASKVQEKK